MKVRQASVVVVVDPRAKCFFMQRVPVASSAEVYSGTTEDPHDHAGRRSVIVRPHYVIQTDVVLFISDYNIELFAEHHRRSQWATLAADASRCSACDACVSWPDMLQKFLVRKLSRSWTQSMM